MLEFVSFAPRWVYDLATGGYRWDGDAARYRSKDTGRFISENAIRTDLDRFNSQVVNANLQDITERMLDGRLALDKWQEQCWREIQDAWGINTRIGRGGAAQMDQVSYGRLGGRLSFESRRLREFAQAIKDGTLTPGQIRVRIGLYAEAVRVGYWDGDTAACLASGFNEERRVLNPAEHCADCVGYASMGWRPTGSLPEPGTQSVCGRNCRCTKERRKILEDGTEVIR